MDASKDTEALQNTPSENEPNGEAKIPQQKSAKKKQSKLIRTDSASDETEAPVRGMPKSGRMWKTSKERFAKVKKTVRGKRTKDLALAYREEIKQIKELSQSIKEDKKRENEEKRLRREENARRRLENERKSEIVQIINNPAKLKRMRKKQLRMIEKRDISKLKVV